MSNSLPVLRMFDEIRAEFGRNNSRFADLRFRQGVARCEVGGHTASLSDLTGFSDGNSHMGGEFGARPYQGCHSDSLKIDSVFHL